MSWNGAGEEWTRLAADTTFGFGKIQSSYLAPDKTFIFGRFQSSYTTKIKGKLKMQWTCYWCCHPWLCIRCCSNIVAIHDCASRYSLPSTFLAQPSHPHTLWRNIFLCFFRVITVANAWSHSGYIKNVACDSVYRTRCCTNRAVLVPKIHWLK